MMALQTRVKRIDVRLTEKAILEAISKLNKSGKPYSLLQLASEAGCCRATAASAVRRLKAAKHISIKSGRGRGIRNRYEVCA